MGGGEWQEAGGVEVSADDPEDFEALYDELRGIGGIRVAAVPAPIPEGDQGSWLEFLTVACESGGAVTVALQVLKTVVESRRARFTLRIRRGDTHVELTAENVDDVLPAVREMLDGSRPLDR